MNRKEGIAKLQRLFMEQESLNESIKEIKDELKASGFNAAVIAKVSKAAAQGKLTELREVTEETAETIDDMDS